MTVLRDLLYAMTGSICITTVVGLASQRIAQGVASKAENELISTLHAVIVEYADAGRLAEKEQESARIMQLQSQFDHKWGKEPTKDAIEAGKAAATKLTRSGVRVSAE